MTDKKVQTNLSIVKDSYTSTAEAFFNSYVMDRYKLTFEGLKIKFNDLNACMDKLMDIDKTFKKHYFPISMFYDFYVLQSENFLITLDSYDNKKKVQINVYYNSYDEVREIFDTIQGYEDRDEDLFVSIFSFFQDQGKNIKNTESIKVMEDFNANSLNYYPYLNVKEMFDQYMMSDGNILLLCGTPGTGKTKLGDGFMRYLLENCNSKDITKNKKQSVLVEDINDDGTVEVALDYVTGMSDGVQVAYVKNEEILARDEFWNDLKENEYHLVFLDDLDYGLLPRTQQIATGVELEKNKFISNLLSFTDGIFEQGNKTKFIITTNRSVDDIDTAVLRKGRTFDILQLRELHKGEANKIWLENDLDQESFDENFGTKDKILQADLGSLVKITKAAKDKNVELEPYIMEEGISLYSKAKNPKKMGL